MMIERRSAPRPCRAAWEGKGSIAVHTRVVLAGRWMLAGIALLFAGEAFSATQTVQWQGLAASEGSIAGYRLYLGPVSGIYTTVFDLGLPTADGAGEFEAWVDVPEGEVFYAVIASYGEEGGEKTRSSEIILGGPTDVSARPLPQDGIDSSQEQDRRWPITVAPLQAMGATRGTGRMLTAPSGDPRLFVVEREGAVRIVEGGLQRGVPFLDLDDQTAWVDGGGLISLAFDPDYAQNGHFFVTHTSPEGEFILTRFSVSDDLYEADPFSGVEILSLLLPYRGNPGGGLAFDADGYLLVAIGDGGGEGDPADLAQDGEVLLGKVLRLDVADRRRPDSVPSREGPYALPADNPFLDDETVRDEIWAFGLRDPGHLSVDSRTGDLWIADRGGRSRHEVDWEPGDTAGGHNYAWDVAEGTQCQVAGSARRCTSTEWTDPVVEYAVTETHCGVVGGFAYRGVLPERQGEYFFMDGCTGQFWSYDREAEAFADWSRVFSGS
ncbi:MAG: PQQ-dependent sugar dehydrogenase, partial [Myxococcota bacterium]